MQGLIGAMSGKLFSSNREGRPCDLSITATSQHAIYESRVTTHGAHGGGLEGGGGGGGAKGDEPNPYPNEIWQNPFPRPCLKHP